MNIFKPGLMNNQQRWTRALIFGIPIGILAGALYFLVSKLLGNYEISLIFILIGYGVAWLIQQVSHGAQTKFKILAVICYVIAVFVGDILMEVIINGYPLGLLTQAYFQYLLSPSGLVALGFRLLGAVVAYVSI